VSPYGLEGFTEAFDDWVVQEHPSQDLKLVVMAWILSRFEDPYHGVRREPEFDNLWFGSIPDTLQDGHVVTCSYWIRESERVVRCDSFATLSLPL
jgi:hypothetical protein